MTARKSAGILCATAQNQRTEQKRQFRVLRHLLAFSSSTKVSRRLRAISPTSFVPARADTTAHVVRQVKTAMVSTAGRTHHRENCAAEQRGDVLLLSARLQKQQQKTHATREPTEVVRIR